MSFKSSVFLIGPGFIGLSIIDELLSAGYHVKTLVRRQEAKAKLEKLGVQTVMGTLEDLDVIREEATAADIVIQAASADHSPSVNAVLDGISERARNGKSSIYIHTSGASLLNDGSDGSSVGDKVYEDDRPEDIDSLPETALHRSTNVEILKRREEISSKAKISIIIPPLIYGLGKESRLSIQIPIMARFAIKHGYAGYAGKGKAVWSHIHVSDLARGYLSILKYMESASEEEAMKNPYFFCENGEEHSWERCAEEIGKGLKAAGKIEDGKAREIPQEEFADLFGPWSVNVIGMNSRCRANRLRALGWKPREKSTFESLIEDELPVILTEKGDFNGYAPPAGS